MAHLLSKLLSKELTYENISIVYPWADYDFMKKICILSFNEILDIILLYEKGRLSLFIDNSRKDTIMQCTDFIPEVYKYDFYFENKVRQNFNFQDEGVIDTSKNLLLPTDEIAVVTDEEDILIINPISQKQTLLTENIDCMLDMAVTRTGVVNASTDGTLRVWNLSDNTHLCVKAHTESVFCVISFDDKIVSGSNSQVKVWTLNGEHLHTLMVASQVHTLTYLLNNTIAIGLHSGTILIWDYITSWCIELNNHVKYITNILKGSKIVSASYGDRINIWSLEYTLEKTIYDKEEFIQLDKQCIISASHDSYIRVYDLQGTCIRKLFNHLGRPNSIVTLFDGRIAAAYGDYEETGYILKIWNRVADIPDITIELDGVSKLFILKDGSLTAITHNSTITIWK